MTMPDANRPLLHTPLQWAQRDKLVFVSVNVEDFVLEDLAIDDQTMHCKGVGGADKQPYECSIEFFADVDGKNYRRIASDRRVELVLPKRASNDKTEWWPRLVKTDKRVPWIRVDFSKWKDEDESDDERGGDTKFDLNNMMQGLGGGGGMGGMGDMDMGQFGDDSDTEDLPDLEDDVPDNNDDDEEGKTAAAAAAGGALDTDVPAAEASKSADEQKPTTSGEQQ